MPQPVINVSASQVAQAINDLIYERDRLRSALERTLSNFKFLLERKPVRDAAETIAEAEAALRQ